MSEIKTFRIKQSKRKPVPFSVTFEREVTDEGADEPRIEEITEKFTAKANLPGVKLLDIAAAMTGQGGEQAAAIRDFLFHTVVEEDQERWLKTLHDEENTIEAEDLAAITDWLMEQYAERPTDTA